MSEDGEGKAKQPVSVYDLVMYVLEQMASVSWQKMGLQPDMVTGKLETDLVEAKVAIDLTAHLAGVIESNLDDEDKRRVHGLVRDLRINYVNKSSEAGS